MKICCLGDSLTEGDYGVKGKSGIANINEKNYPYFLSQNTGWEVKNFGFCGVNPTHFLGIYNDGGVDVTGADVVVIMLGTNGGLDPKTDTQANADYRKIVEKCKEQSNGAKIAVVTPPHATNNPEFSNYGFAPRVNAAVDFVREFAKVNDVYLFDLANTDLFTDENENVMQANDGLHFVEIGYKTLAEYIEKEIRKII